MGHRSGELAARPMSIATSEMAAAATTRDIVFNTLLRHVPKFASTCSATAEATSARVLRLMVFSPGELTVLDRF